MNQQLLPLKDFHLPPEPSFWPLAPGWWAVIGFILLIIAAGVWIIRRHRRKARRNYRREALLQLQAITATFEREADLQALSMNVNRLLKRIALNAINQRAAKLTDQTWIKFLNEQLNPTEKAMDETTQVLLAKQPYTNNALLDANQIERALSDVKRWIDKHQGELINANI